MNERQGGAVWASQRSSTFNTETTDFVRHRLRLFFAVGGLSGGFFLVFRSAIVLLGLGTGVFEGATLLHPSLISHFLGVAPMLAGWLLLMKPQSPGALLTIESACIIPSTLAYIAMAGTGETGDISELMVVLVLTYVFVLRAALIPSTARRTALITGPAAVGLIALAVIVRAPLGQSQLEIGMSAAFMLAWWGVTTSAATTISHVIWGLRSEVREAQRIGQYTLEGKLGEGGMGVVHRASHARLRRSVAIKMLRPESLVGEDILRFEREAQITADLQSPHTIQLFDFGQAPDGTLYYAMELLDGYDLQAFVKRFGPLRPERAVYWLLQACRSLAEAHAAQLVHRDLKPSNLYVCRLGLERDVIKVLDFGLVKTLTSIDRGEAALTATGIIRGTPAYLAPESATKGTADHRSDIYALGCLAWFLLVGRPPFEADSPIEVIMKHVGEQPLPPSEACEEEIPPPLDAVVLSCMAKDPDERLPSIDALEAALEEISFAQPWNRSRAQAWWESHSPS